MCRQGSGNSPTLTSIRAGASRASACSRASCRSSGLSAAMREHAEAVGEADEVRVDQVARDHAVAVELALHAPDVAVGAVVEHDRHDGDAVLHGGRELLDVVHEAAVAVERDHRALGPRDLGAERGRIAVAERALVAARQVLARAVRPGTRCGRRSRPGSGPRPGCRPRAARRGSRPGKRPAARARGDTAPTPPPWPPRCARARPAGRRPGPAAAAHPAPRRHRRAAPPRGGHGGRSRAGRGRSGSP